MKTHLLDTLLLLPRLRRWTRDYVSFWGARGRRVFFVALLGLLLTSGTLVQRWHVERTIASARKSLVGAAEIAYVPPVDVLRLFSLGHQSFLADLLFVRASQYFIDHLISDRRLPWLDTYLSAIIGLDAHNRTVYRWAAQVVKFSQYIDNATVARSNRYARLGISFFPNDGWYYQEIAFNLQYHAEFTDLEDKHRRQQLAIAYLDVGFMKPGFDADPNYLVELYSREGSSDGAVALALRTYYLANEEERFQLRRRLESFDRGALATTLRHNDVVHKRDLPYLKPELVAHIGPKVVPRVPLEPWRADAWVPEPVTPVAVMEALEGAARAAQEADKATNKAGER